jgi:hypothetical protein
MPIINAPGNAPEQHTNAPATILHHQSTRQAVDMANKIIGSAPNGSDGALKSERPAK